MKKYFLILCAAVLALSACNKADSGSSSNFDYSEVVIKWSAMENLTDYIDITFNVDGESIKINKSSGNFEKKITKLPASGTITCKAVVNESYAWGTEKINFIFAPEGYVGTAAKTGGWNSLKTLDFPGKIALSGIKPEKAREAYESYAELLNEINIKYSIDAKGTITLE